MNYRETVDYIESFPMGNKKGLDDTRKLLAALGNPEKDLRFIHVAGTNGKGSTCSYLSEMLMAMGYRVGLYTSPYLEEFNERIQLNGQNISDEDLVKYYALVKEKMDDIQFNNLYIIRIMSEFNPYYSSLINFTVKINSCIMKFNNMLYNSKTESCSTSFL